MLEQKQITLTVDADMPRLLRRAAATLRALVEALPVALAEARLHLRREARELALLARAIEKEMDND